MINKEIILIFSILILVGFILVGCSNLIKPKAQDFEIKDVEYEYINYETLHRSIPKTYKTGFGKVKTKIDHNQDRYRGWVTQISLNLISNQKKLYAKIYDEDGAVLGNSEPIELKLGDNKLGTEGDKDDRFQLPLNLGYESQIKVCVSKDVKVLEENDETSDYLLCKNKILPLPKLDIEISPNPMKFEVSKERSFESLDRSQWLTVRNLGNIPLESVEVILPNWADERLDYPSYKPQYLTLVGWEKEGREGGTFFWNSLRVGGIGEYGVKASIGDDTPIGIYTTETFVVALRNPDTNEYEFKESFILETVVGD